MYLFGSRADAEAVGIKRLAERSNMNFLPLYRDDDHQAIDDAAWSQYEKWTPGAAIIVIQPPTDSFQDARARSVEEPYGLKQAPPKLKGQIR